MLGTWISQREYLRPVPPKPRSCLVYLLPLPSPIYMPIYLSRNLRKMANACAHSFRMIKSDSTLIQWVC
ncbi:hypothetical protein CEP53_005479 [Fusarium sp. AF-6]|nr:hypothetical protein CEP53_005479 [Fusarium sp. AF-6]